MLERPGLLLGPWTLPPELPGTALHCGSAATRAVLDPVTGARLGVVRRRRGRCWPRWLGRQTLEVFETEDDSLLCTVHAPWLLTWAWEVHDAEERHVAIVRGSRLCDGYGRLLAVYQQEGAGRAGCFLSSAGGELGTLTMTGAGIVLQFSAALANQPFAKMALLGALLGRGQVD